MSKQRKVSQIVRQVTTDVRDPQGRVISPQRHCPICWDRCRGYGMAYSTQGEKTYYKCCLTLNPDEPPCGHTWTAITTEEVITIQHKIVEIKHQPTPNLFRRNV